MRSRYEFRHAPNALFTFQSVVEYGTDPIITHTVPRVFLGAFPFSRFYSRLFLVFGLARSCRQGPILDLWGNLDIKPMTRPHWVSKPAW